MSSTLRICIVTDRDNGMATCYDVKTFHSNKLEYSLSCFASLDPTNLLNGGEL